jgi:adenosylhomocysteine nucleosidase
MPAIIGTRANEIDLLCAQADIRTTETYAGKKYFLGMLDGADVILTYTGVGRIAAAVTTQILFDRFDVDEMILTGTASPLVPYLQQGDVVVCERAWQFDPAHIAEPDGGDDAAMNGSIIPADEAMVRRITDAYREMYSQMSNRPQLIAGTIVSDDRAIFDRRVIALLHRELGAVAVDRESATVAEVCRMNERRFAVVHTIVDTVLDIGSADNQSGLNAISEHVAAMIREALTDRQPVFLQ